MAQKLTRPQIHDNTWQMTTCTPDKTETEFFEFEAEALAAARLNLHPTVSTYVSEVQHQGEHRTRGTARHIAILVTVDDEMRRALRRHNKAGSRAEIVSLLQGLLEADLAEIVAEHRTGLAREGDS